MLKIKPRLSISGKKIPLYLYSVIVGIISGLIIVGYRTVISFLESLRFSSAPRIVASLPLTALWLGLVALGGLATAFMVRYAPLIKGSGIPQVKALLMRRLVFGWKKELPMKFVGGSLALGAGLSLGREGPSIQLGALTGVALTNLTDKNEYQRYLVTAGAAAGISAAFNAPLAGVIFCIEELHRNVSPTMLTCSLIASFSANIIMLIFFGDSPVFHIPLTQVLPLNLFFTTYFDNWHCVRHSGTSL